MAQVKISELPEAFDGNGYVPIVQNGTTNKYDLGNKIDASNADDFLPAYWQTQGSETLTCMGFGHVTNSSKSFEIFIPWAKAYPGTYSVQSLSIVPRWSNVGYLYARSGDGSTYTILHDGFGNPISIWDNVASVRTNEVANITVTPYKASGFRVRINFNYALTKNNSGTAVENNSCGDFIVSITLNRS